MAQIIPGLLAKNHQNHYIENFKHLNQARRRFVSIFGFWTQDPCHKAILDPRATIWENLLEDH